ncbi:hypothetical protein LUZ60_015670 [Juncus effusus]|nr:hypothetical protein LUZ60_015670 [Juncus effusus]
MSNSQLNPKKRHRDDEVRKCRTIEDRFNSVDQVKEELQKAGLESSNLIVGIDFTKSNEWTGRNSFNGMNLHHIGDTPNQYEQAISIIGQTLSNFDEDNLIPCFGFGDARTHDKKVTGAKSRHDANLSHQEDCTIKAIVKASRYPLSIVLVGVGDGPWDVMKKYDDKLNERLFDNFQFVNFTEIMSRDIPLARKEAAFALEALMEIPSQFKAVNKYNLCSGEDDLQIGTSRSV